MHPYYEKFTNRSRAVLQLASRMASQRQSPLVSTLHLLWGILEEGKNTAATALANIVDPIYTKLLVEAEIKEGDYKCCNMVVPYGPDTCQCLCTAIEYGRRVQFVASHHLLLGLLSQEFTPATRILCNAGVTQEAILADIKATLKPIFH